ncbi:MULTISPECIES: adenylate/guanylate cyclase domain-containing protein [unclassified Agromyces]|uniref:adenylate/guanylate cyclase domain-containing protein n=1 Tax=unclassified Agromyces TaxID=2639701 RepID=UPI003015390D
MDGSAERYTREELVERSGADSGFVDRVLGSGAIAPDPDGAFGPGDVQRVRLLEACDRAGLSAEAIGGAVRSGRLSLAFLDAPQYRWSELRGETYGELATRLGMPFEVIGRTGAALVNRHLRPGDPTREDDEAIFTVIGMVAAMVDVDAIMRIGRVYVDALRRVSEAESELFQTHIVGGLMRAGLSYGEALERSAGLGAEMTPLMEQMVLTLYRRQQERGWTAGIVEGIERALESSGSPHAGPARPPAFVFIDLSGYTRLTDEQGDAAGARLARRMSTVVDHIATEHAGTPVKWLGDGVMVHFRHVAQAVRATLETVAAAPGVGLPAHAGIAAGPVVTQDGDYFGRAVNLASRISAAATAGQTLVSGAVVELADDPGLSFREVGPVELKGIAEPVTVFEATAVG